MALGPKKEKKNRKNLMYIAIVVLLLGGSFVVFFKKGTDSENRVSLYAPEEGVNISGSTEVEQLSLQNLFNTLNKYGQWPVRVERDSLGRSNPFLPTF